MPQKKLQQAREAKRSEKAAARAARDASRLLDPETPAAEFTKERAAAAPIDHLYVDPDQEAAPADGDFTNDLLNAPTHLREQAETWLDRFAKRMPTKDQWSISGQGIAGETRTEATMLSADYVRARCHSWQWSPEFTTLPLRLFHQLTNSLTMEMAMLMDSEVYLHAEMELSQVQFPELQSSALAAGAADAPEIDTAPHIARALQNYYLRVIINETPVTLSDAQFSALPRDRYQCAFWSDAKTQRLVLLCTVVDTWTHKLIAHFYIPQLR